MSWFCLFGLVPTLRVGTPFVRSADQPAPRSGGVMFPRGAWEQGRGNEERGTRKERKRLLWLRLCFGSLDRHVDFAEIDVAKIDIEFFVHPILQWHFDPGAIFEDQDCRPDSRTVAR